VSVPWEEKISTLEMERVSPARSLRAWLAEPMIWLKVSASASRESPASSGEGVPSPPSMRSTSMVPSLSGRANRTTPVMPLV
jgi:hypothetical protein